MKLKKQLFFIITFLVLFIQPVLARAVYYAAVDKFEKARQVDPSCADEANSLIGSYRAHCPSTEEVFMHPDLEKGQAITIGGWIGEQTRVR